ncbi:MAG: DUF4160 domain-containing protein [Calditrichaeota bacterium]|nr:DUF4160 domain-containing protein [Calditrichota bacterium]
MPKISEFFGISIYMYYSDHVPPHLHARYAEYMAEFDFDGKVLTGKVPPRVAGLVVEWIFIHQVDLNENWSLAREKLSLNKIEPLE